MIISIDGPMGQGKSETLSSLQEESYSVCFLPKSREISMKHFCQQQDILLSDRINYLSEFSNTGAQVIIESSFVDMFVYSLIMIGFKYEYSDWLDDFYDKCALAQQKYIDHVIMLPVSEGDHLSMAVNTAEAFYLISSAIHEDISNSIHYFTEENRNIENIVEHVRGIKNEL